MERAITFMVSAYRDNSEDMRRIRKKLGGRRRCGLCPKTGKLKSLATVLGRAAVKIELRDPEDDQ